MPDTATRPAYGVGVENVASTEAPPTHLTMSGVVIAYGPSPVEPTLLSEVQAACSSVTIVRNNSFQTRTTSPTSDASTPPPGTVEIALTDNLGYAGAANIGARNTSTDSEVIVFITPDVIINSASLLALRHAFSDPLVGAAGPVLQVGTSTWFGGTWGRNGHARHRMSATDARPLRWIDGSCLAVRRSAFDAIGGFDERVFLYGDDLGLCLDLERVGHLIIQVQSAHATQHSGMRHRSGAHGYLLIRNEIRIAARTGGNKFARRVAAASMARVVVEVVRARRSTSRRHHLRQAIGMTAGIVHGVIGRTGPPPKRFRRWSDIRIAGDGNG
jgi:N-acetylglucosaminyl-diphospho-decaprenol L-rhamnosyltransferase